MIKIQSYTGKGHQFKIQAKSGETLMTSVNFPEKGEMDKTIRNLVALPFSQNNFERQTNTKGEFLFNLKDNDGSILGNSEPYDSEAGMENGIKNLSATIKSLM